MGKGEFIIVMRRVRTDFDPKGPAPKPTCFYLDEQEAKSVVVRLTEAARAAEANEQAAMEAWVAGGRNPWDRPIGEHSALDPEYLAHENSVAEYFLVKVPAGPAIQLRLSN